MTLVVDASIVVKWLLNDPEREEDTERATRLMRWIVEGREPVVQPVHWLVEVGAVLARLSPETVADDLLMLQGLELAVDDSPGVLGRACRLAVDLEQHLFDTLYHALALELPDAILLTADDRYLRAAGQHGRILRLSAWTQDEPVERD
ncbi:MAG TPA: type II toxin-antitoxin system VapC family toxin [Gammaproteobacteria bacterium]|jgi:predicted nucleic acid-binding protein